MHFKQTIYTVLYAKLLPDNSGTEWKEEVVKNVKIEEGRITEVVTIADEPILIDDITSFAREGTGMFDKNGNMLFGGDIVRANVQKYNKAESKLEEGKDVLLSIIWVNGAYCCFIEGIDEPIYLNQQNVLEMEKVGNIYQHGKILEKPVDEAVFEADKKE